MMKRRWEVVRCWAAANGSSVMVPSSTGWRFWTRRGAQRMAGIASMGNRVPGGWYEARRISA